MKDLYPKQLEIAQAVAAMLSEVGIKVNIRNLEIATAREQRTAGNYDLFFSGWAHMPHDPDWYFGSGSPGGGGEAHALFRSARRAAHRRGPRARSEGAPAEVRGDREDPLEDEPEIWPYYSVAIYAISDKLRNFEARRDYTCSSTRSVSPSAARRDALLSGDADLAVGGHARPASRSWSSSSCASSRATRPRCSCPRRAAVGRRRAQPPPRPARAALGAVRNLSA